MLGWAVLPTAAQESSSQDMYPAATPRWTVHAQGGLSWAAHVPYTNLNAFNSSSCAPAVGIGASYDIKPWLRVSADWLYSTYKREQQFTALDETESTHRLFGDYKVNYHNLEAHADFNMLNVLWKNRRCKWLNVYLGTGVGGMFAFGSEYEMRITESGSITVNGQTKPLTGNITVNNNSTVNISSTGTVQTKNTDLDYNRLYIPAIASVEANIGTRVTVGVKGQMNFILGSTRRTPCRTAYLMGTVGYRIGGTTNAQRFKKCAADLDRANAHIARLRKQLEEERRRSQLANEEIENLRRSLDDCIESAKRNVKEQCLVVLFDNDVADISQKGVDDIKEFLTKVSKTAHFEVIGEASATGASPHNYDLSEMRLANVLVTLGNNGISTKSIKVARAIGDSRNDPADTARRVLIVARNK